jgi:hypothetical protein
VIPSSRIKLEILSPWSGVIWGVSPTISATCPTPVIEGGASDGGVENELRWAAFATEREVSDVTNVVDEDVARRAEA